MTTTNTTTKTTEVCLVCETRFISEGLPTGWRAKNEIPDDVSVCPWCVNRGWPKFRVMFQALTDIAAGGPVKLSEEALWCVVGVPSEVAAPAPQEAAQAARRTSEGVRRTPEGARKVVRRVKRRS